MTWYTLTLNEVQLLIQSKPDSLGSYLLREILGSLAFRLIVPVTFYSYQLHLYWPSVIVRIPLVITCRMSVRTFCAHVPFLVLSFVGTTRGSQPTHLWLYVAALSNSIAQGLVSLKKYAATHVHVYVHSNEIYQSSEVCTAAGTRPVRSMKEPPRVLEANRCQRNRHKPQSGASRGLAVWFIYCYFL